MSTYVVSDTPGRQIGGESLNKIVIANVITMTVSRQEKHFRPRPQRLYGRSEGIPESDRDAGIHQDQRLTREMNHRIRNVWLPTCKIETLAEYQSGLRINLDDFT